MKYLMGWGISLILLISASFANENIQQLQFKRFNIDNGLPTNYTENVFVDSEGMVWVGSQQGLSMFDAYTFTNYAKVHNDTASLSSNHVADIFESHDSTLWIGTYNGGLNKFDRRTRLFKRYIDPKYGISSHTVRKIVEDKEHQLWLGTHHGVFKFDPATEKATQYRFSLKYPNNTELTASSRGLCCDKNGDIWAGAGSFRGLFKYNKELDTFLLVENEQLQRLLQKGAIRHIVEDKTGTLWICTNESGLIEYSPLKKTAKHYTKDNGLIHSNNLMNLHVDVNDNIWMSSFNNEGMAVIMRQNKKLAVYKTDDTDHYSIPSNSITSITQDNEGNYWVSSHGGGIAIFRGVTSGFSHYKKRNDDPSSLSNNIVSCFAEDSKGAIWIGTDGGGLNRFDRSTNTFERFTKSDGLRSNVVLSILPTGDNELLLAGWDLGLCHFNTKTNRATCYSTSCQCDFQPKTNNIKFLFQDSYGTIWHANHSLAGMSFQLKGQNKVRSDSSLTRYPFQFSSLAFINQIFEDSEFNLWVGTNRGLYLYRDSIMFFDHDENDSTSIASNYILEVFEDYSHQIWIGTAEGLQVFDKVNLNFINYSAKHNLPKHTMGILQDRLGNLWISSSEGLMKFNSETGEKTHFDAQSGLQGVNFFQNSCFMASDGEMYFGSTNGFTRFYPEKIVKSDVIPRIKLTDFQIFNKSKYELITENGERSYEVTIPYKWSVLSFDFSVLSYWSAEKNMYSYMLEGFDKDWCDAGSARKATYTNLDPGEYTFRVKGASGNGVWNNDGFTVNLTVLPPFWLTWWFRVIVTVFVLGMLFGFYFHRINDLKLQKIKLENEVKRRTFELKLVNSNLEEQKEEILMQNEQLELQKEQLEEYNESILRKTGEVLLQREKILDQNEQLETTNRELDELVKTKDKFFSIIAHDLKNPINAIMGFSELMIRRFENLSDDKKKEFVTHINLSANSIYNLLVNLLDWARSQSQNLKPKPKNYLLSKVFDDNRMLISDMAESKGIRLEMYADASIVVFADINVLNTVLRNLVSNGIKFTGRNGVITVIAHEENEHWVQVSVQDTGIGMTNEKLETLFSIEKNTSTTGTEHEKGTGLGLLVVKEFVSANGGSIAVSSTVGEGSKFTFTIPKGNCELPISEI